ncbi:MAG: four-carbon acid sugar kinase family protein [Planctomycetota bacterium]
MIRALVIADDCTGALEAAARCRCNRVLLTADPAPLADTSLAVVDTDSRALAPREAAARIRAALARFDHSHLQLIYKKTDSTLRGNIGAELGALCDAVSDGRVVYLPAHPRLARSCIGGVLHVDGVALERSPANRGPDAVATGTICDRFAGAGPAARSSPVLPDPLPGGVTVLDAADDAELAARCRELAGLSTRGPLVCAGPVGALYHLLPQLGLEPPVSTAPAPLRAPRLLVCGSRHAASLDAVAAARDWQTVQLDSASARDDCLRAGDAAAALLAAGGDVILRPSAEPVLPRRLDAVRIARYLARAAIRAIGKGRAGGVLAFGGDTNRALLLAARQTTWQIAGTIADGLPWGLLERHGIPLVSKSGGYDPGDLLADPF